MSSSRIPKQPFHIAIIGGGIGGLSLAIGLLKYQHMSVTIYEAASCFDEIGAGVGFGPNAIQAMQLLHPKIYEGFQAISTTNGWESKLDEWYPFYLGMDVGKLKAGTLLATVKSMNGESPSWTVHRKDFLKVFASLVPKGTAVFGKRVVDLNQSRGLPGKVAISFQDGTTAEADAVIGCDGVRSVCREFVFGEDSPYTKQVFSGKYCYRGLVPMDKAREVLGDEVAMNKVMYLGMHGHILTFPVQQGDTMNVVAFRTKADGKWEHPSWLLPTTKENMMSDFEGYSDEAMKMMRLVGDSPSVGVGLSQWALFDHPPAPTYYNSCLCLTGDAAHASTPHQGAGAGQAIEDAFILSNLLGSCGSKKSISSAFAAYDSVRRPRTQMVVETSRKQGILFDLEDESTWNGDELHRDRLGKIIEGRIRQIWDINMPAQLAKAMRIFDEEEERRKRITS